MTTDLATDLSALEMPPPFVDLGPYLTGDVELEKPTVANVLPDGRALFYAGRLNEVHGEPGEGKTNVLISACNAVVAAGGRVLYLDPEDNPQGFGRRATGLGGDAEALKDRCHYLHNPTPEEITAAQVWAGANKPDLVVLDGFAEALAAEGLNEDVAGDVLKFLRERLRPFAEAGAAVVVADHVTKSSEGRGRWARGSGAKLGRYDGLVLAVELGQPYTPTEPGFVRLKIAKDRNGGVGARGAVMAEVHFTPANGVTKVEFRATESADSRKPTVLMERVLQHVLAQPGDSKTAVCSSVGGKKPHVMWAINLLIAEGAITSKVEGVAMRLYPAEGATSSQFPTSSRPVPGTGQGVVRPVPTVPPPIGGTGTGHDAGKKMKSTAATSSPRGVGRPGPFKPGEEDGLGDFANDAGTDAALAMFAASLLQDDDSLPDNFDPEEDICAQEEAERLGRWRG
jgi:hypothetical protein